MALILYENLQPKDGASLLWDSHKGFRDFLNYLYTLKGYYEQDEAIKKVSFNPIEKTDEEQLDPEEESEMDITEEDPSVWVELDDFPGQKAESEAFFRYFFDDGVTSLYEFDPESSGSIKENFFKPEYKIDILDRDEDNLQLKLSRRPVFNGLLIRPNTHQIKCQIRAIEYLQNNPWQELAPLIRLIQRKQGFCWEDVRPGHLEDNDWLILTEKYRSGCDQQRRFVEIALGTPDFAFLEGPPGSGKTTAITELILQLILREKRVLLAASTHVALDNVIIRLMAEDNAFRDLIIPVRIGEGKNVSELVRKYQLKNMERTERARLIQHLLSVKSRSESQQQLLDNLNNKSSDIVQRMILECSNLVCGTTIGFLQHPFIKEGSKKLDFDYLIIDEASKTTFQEFIVPAIHAKRWVLVGDVMQLSPYVDSDEFSVCLDNTIEEDHVKNACVDAFLANEATEKSKGTILLVSDDEQVKTQYKKEADAFKLDLLNLNGGLRIGEAPFSSFITGTENEIKKYEKALPLDISHIRADSNAPDQLLRRLEAYQRQVGRPDTSWSNQLSWRLSTLFSLRNTNKERLEHLSDERDNLIPVNVDYNDLKKIERICFPSVLESLQCGFERNEFQKDGSVLTDGFDEYDLDQRNVLLEFQHRMHPEIAKFSRIHFYDDEALQDAQGIEEARQWGINQFNHRAVWVDVGMGYNPKNNTNIGEADEIVKILDEFIDQVKKEGNRIPRSVAVLTFYRGQEKFLRTKLRKHLKSGAHRYFTVKKDRQEICTIELCTVDRFQGHEADMVLLSFVKNRTTHFLESPNRLNVALTRARFQLVLIGNRTRFLRKRLSLMADLANDIKWEKEV